MCVCARARVRVRVRARARARVRVRAHVCVCARVYLYASKDVFFLAWLALPCLGCPGGRLGWCALFMAWAGLGWAGLGWQAAMLPAR